MQGHMAPGGLRACTGLVGWLVALPIHVYRRCISPLKPPTCRFSPTCSAYALEAVQQHGPVRGLWLAGKRICRCHPFGEPGFDPVPPTHAPMATAPLSESPPRDPQPRRAARTD
jgi:uncharacterized protein